MISIILLYQILILLLGGVYVNRGALDFLISHAPIKGKINKEIENI